MLAPCSTCEELRRCERECFRWIDTRGKILPRSSCPDRRYGTTNAPRLTSSWRAALSAVQGRARRRRDRRSPRPLRRRSVYDRGASRLHQWARRLEVFVLLGKCRAPDAEHVMHVPTLQIAVDDAGLR